jgi:ATP-dependent DNA ligase
VLSRLREPIRYSPDLDGRVPGLIRSVREQGFEGLVAKRRTSIYEAGQRSGVWLKMRVNRRQEFVMGGYTVGPKNFGALIFGYYEDDKLILCRSHSQRIHTSNTGKAVSALPPARDATLLFRQSTRSEERPPGIRAHRGKDERMSLVEAEACRTVRVC